MRGTAQVAVVMWLFGLSVGQPASNFVPICDPDDFAGSAESPVPDLPNQFSFTVEGNLIESNSTAVTTEYYDGPGNRGRLEFRFNGSSSMGILGIFDYNLEEIFVIPDFITGDNCKVYTIAYDPPRFLNFTLGVENRNGTIHIGSPRTFLEQLRDDVAAQYIGEDMVRGIPTQRWQACFSAENNSYLIDYYFAAESWDYEGQERNLDGTQMVPVQFTLNATRIMNGTVRNIYHIYSVVDFRAGPDSVPDSLFRVPNGLACTGRFPGQPLPPIPQFFSTYIQQTPNNPASVQTLREFYDFPHQLFRMDILSQRNGSPNPISLIHDFSTSVQYVVGTRVRSCTAKPLEDVAPYFFDIATGDDNMLQIVSPNNFFFLGNEFNYSYEGVSRIRGVDVDSWVSVRDFERVTSGINLTDAIYEVFFTRPGVVYATDRSVSTDPVPWRIKITGNVNIGPFGNFSGQSLNLTSYEMDFFDFSTEEPPYDAFDISSCSGPDDFHTMIMIIPGQEKGLDFGQLRRNIRTSVSNYTGLRPLQIGNIQIISGNGTHIFVTFQISNLTSLAKIDPATNVTAHWAMDLITSNTVDSKLPFQIQIAPNVSVTPLLHVAGHGRLPTCENSSCNCSVPVVDQNVSCSTPNCATPPNIPPFFSTSVQQIDQFIKPPTVHTFREFYDQTHNLFRFDFHYNGLQGGSPGPLTIIHDLGASVQYIVSKQILSCYVQPLQEGAPYFWDLTTDDNNTLQLVSANNLFFRGTEYNYTYQGVTNIRGVYVDHWVSYRKFEQIVPILNFSNAYYHVYYTRPGWNFSTVHSVTTQPVPWRIVINGTVTRVNITDNTTVTYNTTYEMDLFDFSTDEPPYDVFDVSACSRPNDYYTMVLIIPGQEKGINFGQLRRNIRTSVSNYTGLRPLQIGNIQIIEDNGTNIFVTLRISNLTSLANVNPRTNVSAYSAMQRITQSSVGSQLPFQIQINPNISVTPTLYSSSRGPNTTKCTISTTQPGLSSGAVAGVAILLFVLGVLLGVLLQLFIGILIRWFRSNRTSANLGESIKYKKQEEEDELKITMS